MPEHRCPENIVRMFDNPKTVDDGRRAAIEWLRDTIGKVRDGEIVFMPDAQTGQMISFTKGARIQ